MMQKTSAQSSSSKDQPGEQRVVYLERNRVLNSQMFSEFFMYGSRRTITIIGKKGKFYTFIFQRFTFFGLE